MNTKLSLTVDTQHFDIDVEEEFAQFLRMQMEKDFELEDNNQLKKLLHAYVRKNYELFIRDKELEPLVKEVEKLLE